ncbi:MAG: bifunctional precorrin-2 dehydrogenase/sirohydrochlorin ferrochelatase [Salinibacter sp.]
MTDYPTYFSAALALKGRKVVVVGGDDEATHKANQLLEAGAELTVISPDPTEQLRRQADDGELTLNRRPYRRGDLRGASLAIVCDGSVGEAARAEADEEGVWLNVLDQAELCDFIAVATFARDGLQFAVHSSGKSAALSRRVRERLESQFDERYTELTRALGEIRPIVNGMIPTPQARRAFWLEAVDEELLTRVDAGRVSFERFKQELVARACSFDRDNHDKSQPETYRKERS